VLFSQKVEKDSNTVTWRSCRRRKSNSYGGRVELENTDERGGRYRRCSELTAPNVRGE